VAVMVAVMVVPVVKPLPALVMLMAEMAPLDTVPADAHRG